MCVIQRLNLLNEINNKMTIKDIFCFILNNIIACLLCNLRLNNVYFKCRPRLYRSLGVS